jgi:hypothetical protein
MSKEETAIMKTEDIEPIIPKRFMKTIEETPKTGLYLIEPHAHWIADGYKTAFVKSKKYSMDSKPFVYLLGTGLCYGIIKIEEPKEISIEEFTKLESKHRIDERTRKKWCKEYSAWCNGPLYFYQVKVIERFKPPRPVTLPKGTQNWIDAESIKFEKLKELPMSRIIRFHAHAHLVKDSELHVIITKELSDRNMIHPYLDFLDRVEEFLIQDWKTYDAMKLIQTDRGRKILLDDNRIVHAWWHLLEKGKRMMSPQFKDYTLTQQKKIVRDLHKNITEAFKKLGWNFTHLKESDSLSIEETELKSEEYSKEIISIIDAEETLSKEFEAKMVSAFEKCSLYLSLDELKIVGDPDPVTPFKTPPPSLDFMIPTWIELRHVDFQAHHLIGYLLLKDGKLGITLFMDPILESELHTIIDKEKRNPKALKIWLAEGHGLSLISFL